MQTKSKKINPLKKAKRLSSDNTTVFIDDGIDIDNRVIHLVEEIDQRSVSKVIRGIQLMLVKNSEGPIAIYINSYGGDVYSGFGLFNFIQSLNVEVTIYVVGSAMSSASIILMAGDIRIMYENSTLMLHTCSGAIDGKSFEIITDAAEHKSIHKQMSEIYGSRSNVKAEKWAKDLEHKNVFIRAEKALELGLIDKIIKRV